jgi:hypothetical protein
MSNEINYMDLREFVDLGYLQEVNRQFLHPLGLALEVIVEPDDGGPARLGGIWDYRDDPEGMNFAEPDINKGLTVIDTQRRRKDAREEGVGYWIQPLFPKTEPS